MSYIDQLRGHYVKSPRWVQSTGGRILSAVPSQARLRQDVQEGNWPTSSAASGTHLSTSVECGALLARLWSQARRIPTSAPLLDGLGVGSPTLADLSRLPIIDKDVVRHNIDDMLAVPRAQMDQAWTAGTKSVALQLYLDKDRSVKEWAFLTHLWRGSGTGREIVSGSSAFAACPCPPALDHAWAWEPGTRELRLSPFRMVPPVMDQYLWLIERYRVAFVYAYPSAIASSRRTRATRWTPPRHARGSSSCPSLSDLPARGDRGGVRADPRLARYGFSEKVAIAGESPGGRANTSSSRCTGTPSSWTAAVVRRARRSAGSWSGPASSPWGCRVPLRHRRHGHAGPAAVPDNCWRLRVHDIASRHCQDYLVTREGGLFTPTVVYPNNQGGPGVQVRPGRTWRGRSWSCRRTGTRVESCESSGTR